MSLKKNIVLGICFLCLTHTVFASIAPLQESNETKFIAAIDTTMWKYLSASDRSAWTIASADSEKAYRTYLLNGSKSYRDFYTLYEKIEKKQGTINELAPDMIKFLSRARQDFEQGLKLDPFNYYLRQGITAAYNYLDLLYPYVNDNSSRLEILLNKVHLETDPLNKADSFNKIGKIYFNQKIWKKARDNFQLSVTNLFEGDVADIDTAKLFDNLYFRGHSQLKLYEDQPALTSFEYARMIAPNEEKSKELADWINYINWDDGNIHASEKYQAALTFYSKKDYVETERAYLDLLEITQTERARNEVQHRLSLLQFTNLDKKIEAIQRLWSFIKNFPMESASGAAIEPSQAEYWESYCKMCLNLATTSYYEDKKTAFIYFQKAAQIESSIRGNAFLNLAIMSINNPELCLSYCDRSFAYIDRFNENEKKTLYDTYYKAYQRKGDFDEALKWFKKFNEI